MNDKLPYGAGSVIFVKENTRRPYLARKYKGKNANGNPAYIRLGCFETREEAWRELMDKADLTAEDFIYERITLIELFEHFMRNRADGYVKSTRQIYRGLIKKFDDLHNVLYKDIKINDMRDVINREPSYPQKRRIKYLFGQLDREAEMLEIPGKRQSQFLNKIRWNPTYVLKERIPFTEDEILRFKAHSHEKDMYIPLILCYTGFRQGELRTLLKKNIDLDKGTIRGGLKTKAGTNRLIPIHPFIRGFVEQMMKRPGETLLLNEKGERMSDREISLRFHMAIAPYVDTHHVLHECRHTFRSKLDSMNVKDNIIRSLMGHTYFSEGDRSYFHPSVEQLREGIMHLWP